MTLFFNFIILIHLLAKSNSKLQQYASNEWTNENEIYDNSRCGLPIEIANNNENGVFKMIGGSPLSTDKYMPWAVLITFLDDNFVCTGTLITKRHVIATASCLDAITGCDEIRNAHKRNIDDISTQKVEEEIQDRVSILIGLDSMEFGVERAIFGDYIQSCKINKIAILKLDEKVPAAIGNHICLPTVDSFRRELTKNLHDGFLDDLTVLAFNHAKCHDERETKDCFRLNFLIINTLMTDVLCEHMVKDTNEEYTNDTVCVEGYALQTLCKDDDDGAALIKTFPDLTDKTISSRWFLLGLASRLPDCVNSEEKHAIFINVPFHHEEIFNWIQLMVEPLTSSTSTHSNSSQNYDVDDLNDDWSDEGICADDGI